MAHLRSVIESPEATRLRREVRDFVDEQLAAGRFVPTVNSWMTGWDASFSRTVAERGWLGMTIPSEYGGHGAGFFDRFVVTEELLAAGAPVAAHWIADRQIAPSLMKFGTESQKRQMLPGIAAGETFFAIGMSEPDSGSDLASVRTTAKEVEGGWRVSGSKIWTSGAHEAHYFIVLVRTAPVDPAARHAGLSQLIIALDAPGLDIRPIISLDGSHHFNEVFLDEVFVPQEMTLGEVGNGWSQVTSELGYERSGPERFLSTLPLLSAVASGSGPELSDEELGRLTARILALHEMSSSIAVALADEEDVDNPAAIVKVMGTTTEGDIAEVIALGATDRKGTGTRDQDGEHHDSMAELLAASLLDRPGFTLRGGTNEVLRGVIARGMGLR